VLTCPRCQRSLRTVDAPRATRFVCARCEGHAITLAALRRSVVAKALGVLWQAAADARLPQRLSCPSCLRRMTEVPIGKPDSPLQVDVCRRCHLIWLDHNEDAYLPKAPAPAPEALKPALSDETRRELALWKVASLREEHERTAPPSSDFERLLGWLGFPVVTHSQPLRSFPVATAIVALSIVGLSTWAWLDPIVLEVLAFLPTEPFRHGGLTVITSFLLHGDALHLIGNGAFLLVFGPHVEELLGSARYLALLFVATILGDAAHAAMDLESSVPLIGASGGLSAVTVYFALAFPKARVRLFFFHRWLGHSGQPPWRWLSLSTLEALVLWVGLQLVGLLQQSAGASSVSSAAHVGGAAAGALAWWWWKPRSV
jgi:membrane associated rhomboid family serine protease